MFNVKIRILPLMALLLAGVSFANLPAAAERPLQKGMPGELKPPIQKDTPEDPKRAFQKDMPPEPKKMSYDAAADVAKFVATVECLYLYRFTERWTRDLSAADQKQIVVELASRLRNTRELRLEHLDDTSIESRVRAGRMDFPGHGTMYKQDLFLENGRCAWALEEMLGRTLPSFTVELNQSFNELDMAIRQSLLQIIEAMAMPDRPKPPLVPRFSILPDGRRIKSGQPPYPD